MEDIQLLCEYADHQSEKAFTELVERHVDLVFSTAVRLVSDRDQARDVVQTVFADLARQARDHRRITVVSGWLYRRTCFAALDLLRANSSRRAREKTAMELHEANAPTETLWQTVAPHLEEAMAWLSQADQDVIVLRFIENKSLREVGLSLGLSEDTAQKRVSRALGRLRSFYSRRGVTIALGLLSATLASNAVQAAASPDLVASVAAASVASAKAVPGGSTAVSWLHLANWKGAWIGLTAAVLLVPAGPVAWRSLRPAPPISFSGPNLIRNSGFEEGTTFWKNTKGILDVTTSLAHSGTASAVMSERSAPYAGPIQQLPLEAMQTGPHFACSAWVRVGKGPAQQVQITIRYDDEEGTHYLTGARGRAVDDRWTEVRGEFEIHPAGRMKFADLFLEGPVPGLVFLVDDVVVLKGQ